MATFARRITETFAKGAPLPPSGQTITYDADLKGFGLRVTAAGARAFILNYRAGGTERRLTIGRYPEWSAAAARKRAETLKRRIDVGEDPMARRHEDRAALSMRELAALYEERHLPSKSPASQRDDKSILRTIILPRLGSAKAASVRYADVEDLHRTLSQLTPYRANRVLALLSKMFSLALKWEIVTTNPAKGVRRNPEEARQRYLTAYELQRLLRQLVEHSNRTAADAVLLLLTGARRMEVLSATWAQFDLVEGVWTKPSASTKQRRLHRVPLSSPALEMLRERRADAPSSTVVFPGRDCETSITDIKRFWASVCQDAQIDGVRLHDLRHTFASTLVSDGANLPLIGSLLGHTQAQTTMRYAHLFDEPQRAAVERLGSSMMGVPGHQSN
ncbi:MULTISPECIES: site-specific integrase [Methylobacterium]|nr:MULTISPECIES: site-specific integrase [Methylobacterium]PIU06537.1 MAG: integrase [Methylobacterium sp. CG09_land_8_20_14_0_10_71_15]PIU11105.1 MAG: integrase [Methylobacterium sp. CG08_land_8_20_14_0_20_71_15]GBU16500.1 integrase [Methylobacterium sp.]